MNTSANKKLIFQVDNQEVHYIIKTIESNEILHCNTFALDAFQSIDLELDKLYQQDQWLSAGIDDIEILHNNNLNTLVPNDFFDENALGSYLQYNIKVFPTDFFASDEIPSANLHNVYVPFVAFNNYFVEKYGSVDYKHIFTPLIEYTKTHSCQEIVKIWLYRYQKTLAIVVYENEKLIFFNSFEIFSKDDMIYYTLFVLEQLYINPEECTLHLIGDFDKNDDYYNILYQYIQQVEIVENKSRCTQDQLKKYFIPIHL